MHPNNIKFILPHCSKNVFEHSFLPIALRGLNTFPQLTVEATSLNQLKASLQSIRSTNVTLNRFYPAPSGSFLLNTHFSLLVFCFCSSYLIASIDSSWLMRDRYISMKNDKWAYILWTLYCIRSLFEYTCLLKQHDV